MKGDGFKINITNDKKECLISISLQSNGNVDFNLLEVNIEKILIKSDESVFSNTNNYQKLNHQNVLNSMNNSSDYSYENFINDVRFYCYKNKSNSNRVKNSINSCSNELINISNLMDFKRIKGIGVKTIYDDEVFLNGLLQLIKKIKD